nr:hypothetical protein Hi04_10k_c1889_00018 [uncultured bacterium]
MRPCFSAACAFAGLARLRREGYVGAEDRVLVNLTGSDRAAPEAASRVYRLRRDGDDWQPDDPRDAATAALWHAPLKAMAA